MIEILDFFIKVSEEHGIWFALLLVIVSAIVYTVSKVVGGYSKKILTHFEESKKEEGELHTKAALYRKTVMPEIRNILSHLAEETGADRALLFEFSNGNSNLVGLPFLYTTATCEVVRPAILPVSQQYQRINTTLIAEFLEDLEDLGYFYIEDFEEHKDTNRVIYNFMKPNGVKSALFYSLYGIDDTIGFIVLTTTGEKIMTRRNSLPRIAESAQLISSLLNYDKLHDELD